MYTIEEIIKKAREVHNNKYDYSKSVYKKLVEPIEIICPEHGSFYQSPHAHLKGQGCPKCGIEARTKKRKYTTQDFIKKAKEIHGDKYDYSKTEYKDSLSNVLITCPKHGDVLVRADGFLSGRGCPICGKEIRNKSESLGIEDFLKRSREVHGNKYNYSKVEYKNNRTKICIICPEHGEFWQLPYHHLNGHGCKKCSDELNGKKRVKAKEEFISDAQKIHGDKYNYSKVNYQGCFKSVEIICPKHGSFFQRPTEHLCGCGCPVCGVNASYSENELYDLIVSLEGKDNVIKGDRTILNGKELDIFIPQKKIAIEFDGLFWHNELRKDKNYHLFKTLDCQEKGIQLIHIFEDEWLYKKEICISRIKNILGHTETKIYARKCSVKEIKGGEVVRFLNENHIQGYVPSAYNLGLFYNDKLVSLMTFGGLRKNLGSKKQEGYYEMLRFCNKINYSIIGGASKLLNYFIKNFNPKGIISYADRRWSNGSLYTKIGFNLEHSTQPNYFYIMRDKRVNRYSMRKDILVRKYGCKKEESEHDFCLKNKWYRIYDCGTFKFSLQIQ